MRRHVLVPLFRATIRPPWLSTGSRTRTLLFCPPATPSNCQGIDDETCIFRPSSARSGPHPPVATSPWKHKPLIFDREALCAFARSLCSVQLSHFLPLCHAPVPFPSGATPDLERRAE